MNVNTSPYCDLVSTVSADTFYCWADRHLFSTAEEEFIGINAVGDTTTNERNPVEDDRRLIEIFENQLFENVNEHCEDADKDNGSPNDHQN